MEKAQEHLENNRYRSYVTDIHREDIDLAIEIAFAEGQVSIANRILEERKFPEEDWVQKSLDTAEIKIKEILKD